jgi:FAD synthase
LSRHYRSLEDVSLKNSWLTIGVFDGVHRGHQEIIKNLTAGAHSNNAPAVVLTFWPHPAVVLGKRENARCLTTPDERAKLMMDLGVDAVITHPFSSGLASLSALEFMRFVNRHLNLYSLWIGYDFALGRKINIPTANIDYPPDKIFPAFGVYACWAWVEGVRYRAAINIGINPTFTPDKETPNVEAHLLDFDRDLYGQEMTLEFVSRLRDELKFQSVDALLEQIHADIAQAREILK